jgi:hypothetical protein
MAIWLQKTFRLRDMRCGIARRRERARFAAAPQGGERGRVEKGEGTDSRDPSYLRPRRSAARHRSTARPASPADTRPGPRRPARPAPRAARPGRAARAGGRRRADLEARNRDGSQKSGRSSFSRLGPGFPARRTARPTASRATPRRSQWPPATPWPPIGSPGPSAVNARIRPSVARSRDRFGRPGSDGTGPSARPGYDAGRVGRDGTEPGRFRPRRTAQSSGPEPATSRASV